MHEEISFLPLLVISVFAVLVPFLTFRLTGGMLPAVVGEVVIGIVFGEHVLGVITPCEWLDFLALFGFAYLMFLSGLEITSISSRPRWDRVGTTRASRCVIRWCPDCCSPCSRSR